MSPQTESSGASSGSRPAVVYFAKAPIAGQVKTRLCPPLTTEEASALYGAFLRRIAQPVPGAETFVYGWPEDELTMIKARLECDLPVLPQAGEDLFERMTKCFAERFAAGHPAVLLRNTDSPDLELSIVQDALAAAGPGRVVIGPDRGGGYYLIALSENRPELFTGLDEGAATVFDATCAKAQELGLDVVTMPQRADVDTFDDLIAMWRER